MEFYAASVGNILPADIEAFENIRAVVTALPDIVFDPRESRFDKCKNQMTCHILCRALAEHFPVSVHDGYFTKGYQHSWLMTQSKSCVIDVYPVASATPFIVSWDKASPWKKLYIESNEFAFRWDTRTLKNRVDQTRSALDDVIRSLQPA